ncbi:MAG: MarR family transcriptional regulator [Candidatus Omnitrophota bacterium]
MKSMVQIAEEVALIGPRIGRKMLADINQVVDLPQAQLFVIMMLFHQGPKRAADISCEMKVSAPTATGIITRLEKAGLVTRVIAPSDRRMVMVEMTPQGTKLAEQLRGRIVTRWTEILSRLSRDDAQKYLELLKKMSEGL